MTHLFIRLIFVYLCVNLFANDYDEIYESIQDISRPTKEDWIRLQDYIHHGERPYLAWLDTFDSGLPNDGCAYHKRARDFSFLKKDGEGSFRLHKKYINCDSEYKKQCVICYGSFNRGFPEKMAIMEENLKKSKFKGHFLYRIGGWPNVENGSLRLIHVPYAFKVCLFKEIELLGYEKVLWLDTSFRPLKNIAPIFRMIKRDGYFITNLNNSMRLRASKCVQDAFEMTDEEMESVHEVASGLIGVDFSNQIGHEIIDRWYQAAEKLTPFLSPRPEQSAFAAIIYKMGLFPTCLFTDVTSLNSRSQNSKHYFALGY